MLKQKPVTLFVTVGYEPAIAAHLPSKRVTNTVSGNKYRILECNPKNSVVTKLGTTEFGSSQGEVP
jgi:hypothetical protein